MKLDATIAILSTDGFEQSELFEPLEKLREAGATVHVVAPKTGKIKGWKDGNWGDSVKVDRTIEDALAHQDDYDALVLPGGVLNPDQLRMREDATRFVRAFFKDGRPVAAICHGPQILIDCGVIEGRELTSYPSIKNDLKNAGARWVDREVVCDQGLVTSRTPEDLPAFIKKTIEEVREGRHAGQRTA
ncbi:MAG: type 1 glutamine amidotransferase [Phycisphaerales bacterium]|nr:type 1 glutamine amidotransferase [Planctomycetota bacterium]MCH8508999.1 type 1 glutamine amidotransferase [Phycisphaerales bacterium]